MIRLLKYRVAFITLLFAGFGGALSLLLKVDEMQTYYPALAALIALCVSLLISFLIKGRWNAAFRNKLKAASVLLFVFFLVAIALHSIFFINSTFKYEGFKGETEYFIKGNVLTPGALQFKKEHPLIISDAEMLEMGFEGPEGKKYAWTQASINQNVLKLIFSYCSVVLFFVATVSLLVETLVLKYGKSNKKLSAD